MPIDIFIVEAYTVMRHGLRLILEADSNLNVIGDAASATEAIALTKNRSPDVIVIDPHLPNVYSMDIIHQIRASAPRSKLLVLTTVDSNEAILCAAKAGVKGYLLKTTSSAELIEAIYQVASGDVVLPSALTAALLQALSEPSPSPEALTSRERDVLCYVTQGLGNKEIASALNISQNTVKTHMRRILSKLNLRSRTEAAAFALQQGLVYRN